MAVELCCGMGAIGFGLRSLGFRVARAYDAWDAAVEIYNCNAPEPVAVQCDLLSSAAEKRIVSECRRLGEVDLLAAGPPCKGFSQLVNGRHHLNNPHNRVMSAIPHFVATLRPRIVLIENVPDLLRHGAGRTFSRLLGQLERPGPRRLHYRVEFQVYDAALYGTPQARRRVLILAVRDGDERLPISGPDLSPLYAAIRHGRTVPDDLRRYLQILQDRHDSRIVSAEQALSDLPQLGPGEDDAPRIYGSVPRSAYQRVMRLDAPRMLTNTRTPAVRAATVSRLRHIPPGGCAQYIPERHLDGLARRFGSAYRKLHPDAPSTALSTKYDCVYHYAFDRSLSVREYARIQGIPDFVAFPPELACRRSAYEMIGNSVPPLLIRAVLGEALQTRGGRV
ncbi:MAG: DNA cytosine methyltransferase [Bryobacteraceae bacterium]|nr:DNA cytosine methyltransferase [Bryobacteraceae bacterium]